MKLRPSHPALTNCRTIHRKRVYSVNGYKNRIIKPASHNAKLGNNSNTITKGNWKGFPMFSLTLEERATCPPDCIHWRDCYGNGTPFAHRFEHGIDLERRIDLEIPLLASEYPRGFVVRLHILGDFYSPQYVDAWHSQLKQYNALRIFGYTAWRPSSDIGRGILTLGRHFPDRCRIRFSGMRNYNEYPPMAVSDNRFGAITCPQMTKQTASCNTCSLCWESNKHVHFPTH